MKNQPPWTTEDLLPSERRFLNAMSELRFGHFQDLSIHDGQLVLDRPPPAIRQLKFGAATRSDSPQRGREFRLKQAVVDFFQHVRSIEDGQIRLLLIQDGLPMLAEEETVFSALPATSGASHADGKTSGCGGGEPAPEGRR